MPQVKNLLLFWWIGLSLATLFFYPLISALSAQPFYMHWGHENTLELFLAIVATGTLMGGLLYLMEEYMKSGHGKAIMTIVVVAVPFLSFSTYIIARQLEITDTLRAISLGMASPVRYSLVTLFVAALGYVSWKYHERVRRTAIMVTLVMSPFIVFATVTVLRAGHLEPTLSIHAKAKSDEEASGLAKRSVFVLLFDELDPDLLYKDGEVKEGFPNIKAFAAVADNYHKAVSPGSKTLTAIPGILISRKVKVNDRHGLNLYEVSDTGTMAPLDIADTSIFSLARDRGFRGVIYGWMFPYCEMLKPKVDECEAFSIYNYATINDAFSIVNPIFTNIILSPRQIPVLGFLKTLIYSQFHHRVASRIYDLAVSSLNTEGPVFEFIHFNLPHSPFVYNGIRYEPASDPWLQNETNYVKQLKHVDYLVGGFLAELGKHARFSTSDVVITSDHGYRVMAPKGEAQHVPLLIKHAGQAMRRDNYLPVRIEVILRGLLLGTDSTGIDDGGYARHS